MNAFKILNKKISFNHKVNKITIYSKNVEYGDIFFAIKGSKNDGNLYIEEAIRKGAKTIVTENGEVLFNNVNIVIVKDIQKYLAECCRRYYGDLSKNVCLIGITGTNGKTTTATLIYKYLRFINEKATLISTNGIFIDDNYHKTNNTTPNIIEIYNILKESIKEKIKYVIMEVSSHSVKLNRIYGLTYKVGGLTNITHDHLDFHKNIEDYRLSKIMFLSRCEKAVLNIDYIDYRSYFNNNVTFYGDKQNKYNEYYICNVEEGLMNTKFNVYINRIPLSFETSLLGKFNVYNIILFISIIKSLNLYNKEYIKNFLLQDINIPGRIDIVNKNPLIFVDFAHTPDAVNNILSFIKRNMHEGKIICVIGMGGDRDKSKRQLVGKITTDLSDVVIFTEDNNRSENVEDIISDIIINIDKDNYYIEYDRLNAIKKALELSNLDDIICVLGRGCEEYLEKNNVLYPFNDKNEILKLIYKLY